MFARVGNFFSPNIFQAAYGNQLETDSVSQQENLIISHLQAAGQWSFSTSISFLKSCWNTTVAAVHFMRTHPFQVVTAGLAVQSLTVQALNIPKDGLVAYYPFNGTANDYSGNELHGVVYGATLTADRFGNSDSAYSFDGLTNYIKIGDPVPPLLQIQNAISLSAWIYVPRNPYGDYGFIVGCQSDATMSGITIMFSKTDTNAYTAPAGHVHFQIGDGSFHESDANAVIPMSQWVHIVATRRATQDAKIYHNAVLQSSGGAPWSGAVTYNHGTYAIGTEKGAGRYFLGIMDDIRIYNRELSFSEVKALYHEKNPISMLVPNKVPTDGLVAYYPFNGTANDYSGNELHGVVYGATLTADRFGNSDSAYSFDGLTNYIKIGDPVPPLLQIQNAISLSAWIYLPRNPYVEGAIIVGCQYDATRSGIAIMFNTHADVGGFPSPSGHIHLQIGDGSFHESDANALVPLGEWVHVVATRSANQKANIYHNAVLQPLAGAFWSGKVNYNGGMYAIGKQKDLGGYFLGNIDEVRIYNRELTFSEVKALYQEEASHTASNSATSSRSISKTLSASITASPTPLISYSSISSPSIMTSGNSSSLYPVNFLIFTVSSFVGLMVLGTGYYLFNKNCIFKPVKLSGERFVELVEHSFNPTLEKLKAESVEKELKAHRATAALLRFLQDIATRRKELIKAYLLHVSPLPQNIERPQVFLSYAWGEEHELSFQALKSVLDTVRNDFDKAGVSVWKDASRLLGNVQVAMQLGIKESNLILLIGTRLYAKKTKVGSSTNVRTELEYALTRARDSEDCILIPLVLEGTADEIFPHLDNQYLWQDISSAFCMDGSSDMPIVDRQAYIEALTSLEPLGLLASALRLDQVHDHPEYRDAFKRVYARSQDLLIKELDEIYKKSEKKSDKESPYGGASHKKFLMFSRSREQKPVLDSDNQKHKRGCVVM